MNVVPPRGTSEGPGAAPAGREEARGWGRQEGWCSQAESLGP